jgi:hypothetical protein
VPCCIAPAEDCWESLGDVNKSSSGGKQSKELAQLQGRFDALSCVLLPREQGKFGSLTRDQ